METLAAGGIDIIIGTHRLLQKDIRFKDLGLVIVDEEQRFGVAHKEFLKKMRQQVDVLTLSATPIPRTLYMSLGGIRDMSTMETPPEERLPIKTYVSEFEEPHGPRGDRARAGARRPGLLRAQPRAQHRPYRDASCARSSPEARIGIGHGQMDEHELARVMDEFTHGQLDVLVCTTIIESGLDIPNVNTIVINQANNLGLAQLYQLRGRVGRGANRAYAYLLYDKTARLTETAKQRLQTIFEATELGAGFQIALRDLEIRGAGNLLGGEQSGYMSAIGFDLYVKLLSGAVERLRAMMRGEIPPPEREGPDVTIDLPLSAHLPPAYVPDLNMRLALYQRLSNAPDHGGRQRHRPGDGRPLRAAAAAGQATCCTSSRCGRCAEPVRSSRSPPRTAPPSSAPREGEDLPREPAGGASAARRTGQPPLRPRRTERWLA